MQSTVSVIKTVGETRVDETTNDGIRAIELLVTVERGADGYEPMGHAIARHVREAILDGRLHPGSRIRQEALARHLGVSRIPVREALRQLEAEGLVELRPHSGARVARMDLAEHIELYRIREALEPIVIAESAARLTDEQIDRLSELVDEIEVAGDDLKRWLECDRRFHLQSYAAAPRPRMLQMIEEFWNTSQHYRRAHISRLDPEELRLVNYEHRLILDALRRRDPGEAEMRQRMHLRRTRMALGLHREIFESGSDDTSSPGGPPVTIPPPAADATGIPVRHDAVDGMEFT